VARDSISNKDILAVSICEAVPANSDTQSTVAGNVAVHKLQGIAEGVDGKDAEPDKEVVDVQNCEQNNTVSEDSRDAHLCPKHTALADASSCSTLASEVKTGGVMEDGSEQEKSVELEKEVTCTYKKKKRRKKAAKSKKKKVPVKKKEQIVVEDPADTSTNNLLSDATSNQRDKEQPGDQRETLDSQTETDHGEELEEVINQRGLENQIKKSDDQVESLDDDGTKLDKINDQRELLDQNKEVTNQRGLQNNENERLDHQVEVDKVGSQSEKVPNQRELENQNKESDDQVEGLDEVNEIDNQIESLDQSKVINQRGLENQNGESDNPVQRADDEAKVDNQSESFDQSKEVLNQGEIQSQSNGLDGQVEGLDDQAVDRLAKQTELADQSEELADQQVPEDQAAESVSSLEKLDDHREERQRELSVDQNEEMDDQRELTDLRQQTEPGLSKAAEDYREDTNCREVLHDQEGVAQSDITLPITATADSTRDLQGDNDGMEAVDGDCLSPIQTSIDNHTQSPYMQPCSASCHNEASSKTSQWNNSVLGQEIEHPRDSNVTTMSFEGQQQSAEKQPSVQGKTIKRLSKKKKGRRKLRPQPAVVEGEKRGRGRPKKTVVQEIADSSVATDDSTVSKQQENIERSTEQIVSSTNRIDDISRDTTMAVTHFDTHPTSPPPDIVTSSDTIGNVTTSSILPQGSSNTTTTPLNLDAKVTEVMMGDSKPCTEKVVPKKCSNRRLRKRQSTVATVESATKKLKFDEVEIKQEREGSMIIARQLKKRKTTMATIKGEVTQQETTVTKVATEAAPLATVNRWAFQ